MGGTVVCYMGYGAMGVAVHPARQEPRSGAPLPRTLAAAVSDLGPRAVRMIEGPQRNLGSQRGLLVRCATRREILSSADYLR